MHWHVDPHDALAVERQLGRKPRGLYRVVARDMQGEPSVIQNYPRLQDGTPMPTLYWLTSSELIRMVGHVESSGGVDQAEAEVDPRQLAQVHTRYAAARDALLESHDRYDPMPSGGVAGTRKGVKCLHAHLANLLAGSDDPVGEWVRHRIANAVAAVDCGTNTTRLLIWDTVSNTALHTDLEITRLGAGVDDTGRLNDEAIERTLSAFHRYRTLLDAYSPTQARAVATSATRDAANGSAFLRRGSEVLGHNLEVITGEEEGRLTFCGAAIRGHCLVVDIGGGSTELALGRDGHLEAVESLQMGAVRLTERFLAHDPPLPQECDALRVFVREQLHHSRVREGAQGASVVAVAGTATSIAAIHLGLDRYLPAQTHHHEVPLTALDQLVDHLLAMTSAQRSEFSPSFLPLGRAEVIVAGAMILQEILAALATDVYVASEHDILHGLISSCLIRP